MLTYFSEMCCPVELCPRFHLLWVITLLPVSEEIYLINLKKTLFAGPCAGGAVYSPG